MDREEAIQAIIHAVDIFVHVPLSRCCDGTEGHTATFRISKEAALFALCEVDSIDHKSNIFIMDSGKTVIIGTKGEKNSKADLERARDFAINGHFLPVLIGE